MWSLPSPRIPKAREKAILRPGELDNGLPELRLAVVAFEGLGPSSGNLPPSSCAMAIFSVEK